MSPGHVWVGNYLRRGRPAERCTVKAGAVFKNRNGEPFGGKHLPRLPVSENESVEKSTSSFLQQPFLQRAS
jgi:hypothetical protein